ncbi:hypothetical protein IT408_02820 [Candidatus Uhrbacteria bacterium]|nr:hypothetical protein [Candidatus Uhrbacteria bacterium]
MPKSPFNQTLSNHTHGERVAPEHMYGMEDVQRYLLQKIQIDHLPRLRQIDIALQENHEQGEVRDTLIKKKAALVEKAKQLKQAAQECDNFRCDPWKFEPYLFADVLKERSHEPIDQTHLNHVRGLLRAGSVFSFDRLSNGQESIKIRTTEEALSLVSKARFITSEYWDWRMHVAGPFHHDPDAKKEYENFKEQSLLELDMVSQAISKNVLGEELEDATRTIEDLHEKIFSLYLKSEKNIPALQDQINAVNTGKEKQYTHWRDLYIQLRPLRNFLYYRRLYPIQAKASLITWKPKTTSNNDRPKQT